MAGPRRISSALCFLIRDEPDASLLRHVRRGPFDHDDEAVAETDQLEDVEKEPRKPGERSREPEAADISNGRPPADDRHVAPVVVDERPRPLPLQPLQDRACRMRAALHRHRRDAGNWGTPASDKTQGTPSK